MKRIIALLLALVITFSFAGCTKTKTKTKKEATTITVTDNTGEKITLKKDIKRIVVCDIYPIPSVLSVFFDSAEKIVGMAGPSMTAAQNSLLSELYPEILKAETGFIDGTNVNTEELLKLNPDIVFYSAENKELGKQLIDAGFSAVGISASKWKYNAIETLNNWIALLSQIFPDNDRAEKVKKYSNDVYDLVQKRVADLSNEEREKVFFLFQYSEANITTSGKLFFGEWWAEAVGAKNVGEELSTDNSTAVNMEQIYKWNPQMIFITNFNASQPKDIYSNAVGNYDWSAVQAVEDKQVYKMPLGMYRSYTPGVDTPITLYWFAKAVYPKLFEDIDITVKTKEYYKDVFGITLTDEQAGKIFKPVSKASAF